MGCLASPNVATLKEDFFDFIQPQTEMTEKIDRRVFQGLNRLTSVA
jgi:hypothetical protein